MKKTMLTLGFIVAAYILKAQVLYGTAMQGGKNNTGTICKLATGTNALTAPFSFDAVGDRYPEFLKLLEASDGKLYGMTSKGGSYDVGAMFSYDPATSTYTKLKDFDGINGAYPRGGLMQASDGKLYGMTTFGGNSDDGVIFSYNIATSVYTKLKDFNHKNGAYPEGSLVQASDGKLYGMTDLGGSNGRGTIFSYDPAASAYTMLLNFNNAKGSWPHGSLVQASDGKLYGMTYYGGRHDGGVIFSYDPAASSYTKLVDLDVTNGYHPTGSLMQASDGKLYGMTTQGGSSFFFGVIFSYDPAASTYTKLEDLDETKGGSPYGSLIQASDGKLYGMTRDKVIWAGVGVIFSYDIASSAYTKLKRFNGTNGAHPSGDLMQASDGNLYGVTTRGGIADLGVIFSYKPATSHYRKLWDFGADNTGNYMVGALKKDQANKLYGMTYKGGSYDAGTIFSYDANTSVFTKLKDFDGTNGRSPLGGLMQASDGKLYGMTTLGGGNDYGVIFSYDPATSTYTKLVDFDGTNGKYARGSLVQTSDGKLYGMTNDGGNHFGGVIFSYDPATSTYTKLVDFDGTNGAHPWGGLIQASDGKLYGMTSSGGSNGRGTIFSYDPATSTYTKLVDFDGTNGAYPYGDLVQASDGKLYGMTTIAGSSNSGVIFSYDPAASAYTKLVDFDGTNGYYPAGSLVQASDGKLYGMTSHGGSNDYGVAFSYDPATSTYTKLSDFNGDNGSYPGSTSFVEIPCTSTTYFRDADNDSFGNANDSLQLCEPQEGYVTDNSDCNDSDAAVHPGAIEVCNGIDDNCDGSVDEGFADTDGDHLADCVDPDDDNDGVPDFKDCEPFDKKNDKVLICHKGNTLCVSQSAVAAHLKHGDTEGPRGPNPVASAGRENTDVTKDLEVSKSNLIEPAEYKLSSYPNPFVGISTIKYELPFDSKVSIKVYDLMGRVIATLVDGDKKAGTYTVDFKAGHFKGSLYYKMIAKSKDKQFEQTNKMIQLQ